MTVDVVPMADISSSSSSSTTSSPSSSSSSLSSSLSSSPSSTRTSSSSNLGSPSAERVRLSKRKQFRPLRSIKREEAGGPSLQSLLQQSQAHNQAHNQHNEGWSRRDLYEEQIFLASKVIVLDFSAEALLLKGGNEDEGSGSRRGNQQDSSESEDLDLGENEKELCSSLNLSPSIYVKLKESVLKEGPKVVHKPAFKKKAKMDVSKTKKLYDFFLHQRWQVAQKA